MMTDKITRLPPDVLQMRPPAPLADLKAWCCWRYEQHEGEAKPRKIPYYASGLKRTGKQGSPRDKEHLTSFTRAREAALKRGFDGIGFAPLKEFDITALDFDACLSDGGNAPEEILQIIGETYAEISPSGTGIRAFMRGNIGDRKSKAVPENGIYGFEVFSEKGFVTFTGNPFWTNDIFGNEDVVAPVSEKLGDLCEKRFGRREPRELISDDDAAIEAVFNDHEPRLGLSIAEIEELLDRLDPDCGREDWIKVGMAVHHETEGGDDGFYLWNEWSSNGGKYPSEEALQEQWDSFTRREGSGRRPVTMATVKRMVRLEGGDAPSSADEPLDAVAIAEALGSTPSEVQSGKFKTYSPSEMAEQPPVSWLIKGILPHADIGMIFGASGAGKSFVALDMACAMARGVDWRGKRTKRTKVLLVAAEGAGGTGNRLKAYCDYHNIPVSDLDGYLRILPGIPNLMNRPDAIEVVKAIRDWGGCGCVVFDTFAQVTPGANENSGEDMGVALANAKAIGSVFNAVVLLIHHSGKDTSKGARGWSGSHAAMDFVLEVVRFEETAKRSIRVRKQKDGQDGEELGLRLEIVTVGIDPDGDEITSCVAVEADVPVYAEPDSTPKRKPLSQWEQIVLDTVSVMPMDVRRLSLAEFALRVVAMTPEPEAGARDTRQFFATRAIVSLAKKGDEVAGYFIDGNAVILG